MTFDGPIPIRIQPLFWLMAIAIGFINSGGDLTHTFVWISVILVSVLIHELGHALTAVAFGQRASIELMVLGGLTLRQGPPLSLKQEFLVVLNGPLVGLLVCGIAIMVYQMVAEPGTVLTYALTVTMWVNGFWTLINLLPVQPLDGGKLLVIAMEGMFGLWGVKLGLFFGLMLSVIIGVYFFAIGFIFPGAIFFMLAFEGYRTWRGALVMTDKDRDQQLVELLHSAEDLVHVGKTEQAELVLQQIRGEAKSGFLFLASTELLGRLAAKKSDYVQAYQLLRSIEEHLDDNDLVLLHQLAYRNQQWKHAIQLGDRVHQSIPSYETALLNALAHATMGEVEAAIGWLRCAIEEGLPDAQNVVQQSEFDPIRNNNDFRQFAATL